MSEVPPGLGSRGLASRHAKVHDASVTYADLTRREADLALRLRRPTAGDLVARSLGESWGGLYGAPRYAAALGTLRRLGDASFITWGEDLAHIPAGRLVAEHVPPEAVVLRTSHMGAQLAAARAGLGLVLVDASSARACGLVEVALAPALRRALPPLRGGETWLVVHRALRDVPRIAAVWEFVLEEVQRARARGDLPSATADGV